MSFRTGYRGVQIMGIDTITVTDNDVQIARMSITNIIMTSKIGIKSNLSFDELVESLGISDMVERMVDVKACDNAWIRYYQNIIHDDIKRLTALNRAAILIEIM